MRPIAVLIALTLLAPALAIAAPPAAAEEHPLHVDAGDSDFVLLGDAASVAGYAVGGTPPYAYAWTHEGAAHRFADAHGPSTEFDTAGLAQGGHTLTLTVTDAQGNSATDTVRVHVYTALQETLVNETGPLLAGAPFIITPADSARHAFTVPPGVSRLDLTLDWTSGFNDVDLYVEDPSGAHSNTNDGATLSKPERITIHDPAPGQWEAVVDGFLSVPDTYTLNVTAHGAPDDPRPRAHAHGPYVYGADEAQLLDGENRGAGEATAAWDLDGDGLYETPGLDATAALPVGAHTLELKLTNDAGYEHRATTTIRVVEGLGLSLHCVGNQQPTSVPAMEVDHLGEPCWAHLGHHTYLPGADRVLTLGDGEGRVVGVEVQLAPPTEATASATADATTAHDAPSARATAAVTAPIVIETSLDGHGWTPLPAVTYEVTTLTVGASADGPSTQGPTAPLRQSITFSFEGDGREFRYLRVRQPQSATQGLAGYLDHSAIRLEATSSTPIAPATAAEATRSLDCLAGDILEDVFQTHPCWFGGVDRYDSPSVMHTYPLGGEGRVDRVEGTVTALPWRSDDYYYDREPTALHNVTVGLYASDDGATWTLLTEVEGAYGAPLTIDLDLPGGVNATHLRLLPERHENYWDSDPLKHMRGFIVDSRLTVAGALPGQAH